MEWLHEANELASDGAVANDAHGAAIQASNLDQTLVAFEPRARPDAIIRNVWVSSGSNSGLRRASKDGHGKFCNIKRYRSPTTLGSMTILRVFITRAGFGHCRRIT